jgi:hypothetical protein
VGQDLRAMNGERGVVILGLLPSPTTVWFTVAAVLAGIVGAAVVWRTSADLGLARIAGVGVLAAMTVGGVSLLLLWPGGLNVFGVAHVLYLGLVVSLPIVGVAVGARVLASTELPDLGALVALVLVLPAGAGWYGTHIEPQRLRVDRVALAVADDRLGDDPVRIGVLTDLQTPDPGAYERDAVDRLMAEEPDLILLPGDLFQGTPQAFDAHVDEMRALLQRLDAPGGVYLVRGDTDRADNSDRLVEGSDIVLLDNDHVDVKVGDRTLRIGGNRLRYAQPDAVALRRRLETTLAEGEDDDGTIRILLAHRPDAILDLAPDSRVDLVVAGHTHGGQIVLPGVGPLVTLSSVPRHVGAGGLHQIDGNPIYVGTGVGLERGQAPQVRLFSRPSIGIIELT